MPFERNLQPPEFTVGNVDTVNVIRGKGYRHAFRNGRVKHGFICLVRGAMTDEFTDSSIGQISLKSGELLFVPKGSEYVGIYTADDTEIRIVQFDIISGTLPAYLKKPVKIPLPNAQESMHAFFSQHENESTQHPLYYLSCLYQLLWQIDMLYSHIPHKYNRLKNALHALSERYFENESVAYYADLCDMSEVNFRRLFKEYTGSAPIEYRNDLRLNSARAKLQSGEYNVSEAAESCGFTNLSFFIRLYKKKFGYTPKKE